MCDVLDSAGDLPSVGRIKSYSQVVLCISKVIIKLDAVFYLFYSWFGGGLDVVLG